MSPANCNFDGPSSYPMNVSLLSNYGLRPFFSFSKAYFHQYMRIKFQTHVY